VSITASYRVLERVTKDSCSGAGNRAAATFQEDDGIDARFRNKLTDFQMSGYDRGHMVGFQLPNGDCLSPIHMLM
jgi:DNA/RNA endonuclease G (NUC1)